MNFNFFGFILFVVCIQALNACEPPDCDRLDCGTCGNACCRLDFYLSK